MPNDPEIDMSDDLKIDIDDDDDNYYTAIGISSTGDSYRQVIEIVIYITFFVCCSTVVVYALRDTINVIHADRAHLNAEITALRAMQKTHNNALLYQIEKFSDELYDVRSMLLNANLNLHIDE